MVSLKSIWWELMKPGWAWRLMGQWAFWLWNQIGKAFAGDRQASTTTTPIQPTQKKQIQTYNPRYPGFDENDYLRLEQIVDGFWETWSKKAQLMDEAYQYYYPQVLNKHKLDERQELINNWVYENGEKLANWDKITNAQYRLLSLSQMAKEKFDLAYNVEDWEIIRNIKEKVPNWWELLTDFLNTWSPEILYAAWIYDKWQEAQDFRSQKDVANEVLGGNFWENAWNNMVANSFWPLDSWEKSIYKWYKNVDILRNKLDQYLADVVPEWEYKDKILNWRTVEEFKAEKQWNIDRAKQEIDDYIGMVNKANQSNREQTVNPIVANYYNRRNFTDLLAEWDIDGFFYKWLWDAASNWDMPVIIWASIVNPAMWTALMGTNSYVRESEEAYENMRNAGATHEQAEAWGAVVWMINSAIEVWLDRALWWVETSTSKAIRDSLTKNVTNEIGKKSFEDIMTHAGKTYVGSSMEEWLEEWLQNIVSNAAEMTVKENPEWSDLFKWGRAAFEWWAFNPMNILAPWGDIISNSNFDINQPVNSVKEWISNIKWDTQDFFLERANKKVQNLNRMTKKQQEKFYDMANEDAWEFMNKRNLKDIDDLWNHFKENLEQVDKAMDEIEWRYKSKILDLIVDEVAKYIRASSDAGIWDTELARVEELYKKNKEWWLEMNEINEIKRMYERTNIFDYLKEKKSQKSRKATKRDTALRNWQLKIAEEAWLKNLKELNKETQLTKYLLDNITNWQTWIKWNNDISLTDWIIAAWWWLNVNSILWLVWKQIYQSSWFQNKLVDVYNYLWGRKYEAWPKVNFENIKEANINRAMLAKELAKVKNEQEFNEWLNKAKSINPALPYNSQYDNQAPIDYTTPTKVTPQWQSIRYGQIWELPITNTQKDFWDSYLQNEKSSYNMNNDLTTNHTQMRIKSYTAEELWLQNTPLSKIDRNKYIPIEDPNTKEIVFYKVDELKQIPITQNWKSVTFEKSIVDNIKDLDKWEKIHISQENWDGYIITKLDKWYRVESDKKSDSWIMGEKWLEDFINNLEWEIYYDFDKVDKYTITEWEWNMPIEEDMDTDENFDISDNWWED